MPRFGATAPPVTPGGSLGQSTGWWRPQKGSGKVALPEGPSAPIERHDRERVSETDARPRDPRTAENIRAHEDALAPRRYRPSADLKTGANQNVDE